MPHRLDLPPDSERPHIDPNTYLAAERTFLAWIRTGLALMGFGFVVARFGLFLRELDVTGQAPLPSHGISVKFGTGLVLLGVVLTVFAIQRYVRLLRELARGNELWRPSRLAVALGAALAAIGAMISVYLLLS
jgi:putative membrane protein